VTAQHHLGYLYLGRQFKPDFRGNKKLKNCVCDFSFFFLFSQTLKDQKVGGGGKGINDVSLRSLLIETTLLHVANKTSS